LQEIYKSNLSPEAIEIYYNLLSGYTAEEFKEAAREILKSRTYNSFPLPAEFIEIMRSNRFIKERAGVDFKQIRQIPTPEQEKEIHDMIQDVIKKCEGIKA